MIDEADQLWGLYIITLKHVICMLDINKNKFSEKNKSHLDFKIETKGDDIR